MRDFIKKWILSPGISEIIAGLISSSGGQQTSEIRTLLADNVTLKDRHKGKRCFILGAGPTIKQQNISRLAGEMVISVSNTFVHPDYSLIRPSYHVLPPVMASHGQSMPVENFVNWFKAMEQGTGEAEMFFHIGDRPMIQENGLFLSRAIHWIDYTAGWDERLDLPLDLGALPPVWSVSEVAISVALYLGFDRIYLLGFDHDWFNGMFKHFYDVKTEHAAKPDESLVSQVDSEYQMRRHADIFRKYKYLYSMKRNIYNANANRNSYVDVFPKVDFDSLFTEGEH